MELLQGESLKQRLRNGPLPLDGLLDIATDVAHALASAHLADIIHRDITPGKHLHHTSRGHEAARLRPRQGAGARRGTGGERRGAGPGRRFAGTVHYLAPEQLLSREVDRRADLFGLGTVLYQAAAGARPFDARSKSEVIAQILSRPALPLRRLAPHCRSEFEQIVMRLLEKEPDRRYQRAGDLLKDLETIRSLRLPGQARQSVPASTSRLPSCPSQFSATKASRCAAFATVSRSDVRWALQQLPGVRAAASTSTDACAGQSIRAIGEQLQVDRVLEGSVQQAGGRIRVIASLLAAPTEEPLRVPIRLDLPASDLLAAQDEAVREVVAAVKGVAARLIARHRRRAPTPTWNISAACMRSASCSPATGARSSNTPRGRRKPTRGSHPRTSCWPTPTTASGCCR